jgi:hypothetical protein
MYVLRKSKETLIVKLVQEAAMSEEEQVVSYIYLMDAGGDIKRREHLHYVSGCKGRYE